VTFFVSFDFPAGQLRPSTTADGHPHSWVELAFGKMPRNRNRGFPFDAQKN